MKRLFDILFSFCAIILLIPVFIIIGIWIILDSHGGIFYSQIRVGRNNRDFRLYKFRTMYTDSDKQGLITIGDNDSRITKAGRIIRKYKIDELPQLLNILVGDMSFVGPRPEVRKYVNMYNAEQLHVLDVRPGLTDAASIKYRNENQILAQQTNPDQYYINVIMPDKLNINLQYVHTHTLCNDLRLILLTAKTVFFDK
ncbi:MAG: sugar transferase [Paludibacteraceae bacterium]|nr:sugar transferase [Paludibacteraceae bacterium]